MSDKPESTGMKNTEQQVGAATWATWSIGARMAIERLEQQLRQARQDAATGIPSRLLYRDPPLHPTATELTAPERWRLRNAFWAARRQNAPHQARAVASRPECGCSQEGQ